MGSTDRARRAVRVRSGLTRIVPALAAVLVVAIYGVQFRLPAGAGGAPGEGMPISSVARRGGDAPPTGARAYDMTLAGVHTTVVADGRRQLTAAAGRMHVGPAPLFGPFRIGFVPALSARDVRIDLNATTMPADPSAWDLQRLLAPLAGRIGQTGVPVDVTGLVLTTSDDAQTRTVLEAERCGTTLLSPTVRCERGRLRVGDAMHSFRSATFAGSQWRTSPARPIE